MRRKFKRYLAAVTSVIIATIWAFPVYWMINSSFLTPLTISGLTPTFVPFGGTLQNYREVTTETPFFEALTMRICEGSMLRWPTRSSSSVSNAVMSSSVSLASIQKIP